MNRPIPILHVLNKCADGSITRIVERIIRFSSSGEFDWHVCSVKGQDEFEKQFEKLGVRVVDCSKKPGESDQSWQKINRYLIDNKIRIIHSHTPRTILEVWKALTCVNPSSKVDAIHLATKHLLTTPKDRKWGLIFALYDHLTLYMPDHLVTVSHAMASEISAHPCIKPSKVTAIPNTIPVAEYYKPEDREACRQELGLTDQMLVIGFTGRIEKVKKLDILINAFNTVFSQYPYARLVIIGEGNLQTALQVQAKQLGIDNAILWPGFSSDIPHMLSAMDIYVQPSVNEGLSLSILEAMAAEKPVIATKVGSAEEIIDNGRTGILVNPGSVTEIAKAIMDLISNTDLRDNLARQGRQFVFNEYNIQKMVNGYCDVYRKLEEKAR